MIWQSDRCLEVVLTLLGLRGGIIPPHYTFRSHVGRKNATHLKFFMTLTFNPLDTFSPILEELATSGGEIIPFRQHIPPLNCC